MPHLTDSAAPSARTRIREAVVNSFQEALELRRLQARQELTESTVLLESGLDSLGFAILIVKLEDTLGYDPFVLMSEPVYPKTFGEFLDVYERYLPES